MGRACLVGVTCLGFACGVEDETVARLLATAPTVELRDVELGGLEVPGGGPSGLRVEGVRAAVSLEPWHDEDGEHVAVRIEGVLAFNATVYAEGVPWRTSSPVEIEGVLTVMPRASLTEVRSAGRPDAVDAGVDDQWGTLRARFAMPTSHLRIGRPPVLPTDHELTPSAEGTLLRSRGDCEPSDGDGEADDAGVEPECRVFVWIASSPGGTEGLRVSVSRDRLLWEQVGRHGAYTEVAWRGNDVHLRGWVATTHLVELDGLGGIGVGGWGCGCGGGCGRTGWGGPVERRWATLALGARVRLERSPTSSAWAVVEDTVPVVVDHFLDDDAVRLVMVPGLAQCGDELSSAWIERASVQLGEPWREAPEGFHASP